MSTLPDVPQMDVIKMNHEAKLKDQDVTQMDVTKMNHEAELKDQDVTQMDHEPIMKDMESTHVSQKDKDVSKSYVCDTCSKAFSRKDTLIRHIKFLHTGEKPFHCNICEKCFVQKSDLLRHQKIHLKAPIKLNCEHCNEEFSQKLDLVRHKKMHKSPKQHLCIHCTEVFNRKLDLTQHIKALHSAPPKQKDDSSFKEALYEKVKHFPRLNSLDIFTKTTIYSNEENEKDFHIFFNSVRSDVLNELNYQMAVKKRMKWYATAQALLSRITNEGDYETATPFFHSKTVLELTTEHLSQHIEDAFVKINDSFDKFNQRGSGWTLEKVLNLELSMAQYGLS